MPGRIEMGAAVSAQDELARFTVFDPMARQLRDLEHRVPIDGIGHHARMKRVAEIQNSYLAAPSSVIDRSLARANSTILGCIVKYCR